jgi:hypothetical protein
VNVSAEAEDIGEEAADCEILIRALVNCRVCELAIMLLLVVLTICKCSINPITNPNSACSHFIHVTIRYNMIVPIYQF